MRYIVQCDSNKTFDTISEAMDYAKRRIYLSPERQPDMEALLEAGKIAQWSYGFAEVWIVPKE